MAVTPGGISVSKRADGRSGIAALLCSGALWAVLTSPGAAVRAPTHVENDLARIHRSAADIESMVRHMLLVNPATDSFQISVQADSNGVVRLTGDVDSWIERELAGRVAAHVPGVTDVRNDLRVEIIRDPRSDSELATEIDCLLRSDADMAGAQIDVSVKDGNVELSGRVRNSAQRARAVDVAWTQGTMSVNADKLKVDLHGSRTTTPRSAPGAPHP